MTSFGLPQLDSRLEIGKSLQRLQKSGSCVLSIWIDSSLHAVMSHVVVSLAPSAVLVVVAPIVLSVRLRGPSDFCRRVA